MVCKHKTCHYYTALVVCPCYTMLFIENEYVQSENHVSSISTNEIEELNNPSQLMKRIPNYFVQKARALCFVMLIRECHNTHKQTRVCDLLSEFWNQS